MHWTYAELLALPPEIYSELVAWLNHLEHADDQ